MKNREMVIRQAAPITMPPLKHHVDVKCLLLRIAPAIGVPARAPQEAMANPIPMRVPIKARFSILRKTKTVGGKETNVPEKNPKKRQNTTTPPTLWTEMRVNVKIEVSSTQGINMFIGPSFWAKKFGAIRPKTEPALRMASR